MINSDKGRIVVSHVHFISDRSRDTQTRNRIAFYKTHYNFLHSLCKLLKFMVYARFERLSKITLHRHCRRLHSERYFAFLLVSNEVGKNTGILQTKSFAESFSLFCQRSFDRVIAKPH